jgi:hypothetical protein
LECFELEVIYYGLAYSEFGGISAPDFNPTVKNGSFGF